MAGKETADCAAMCAKKGAPLALLTSDGKVYTIAGGLAADKNAKLIAAHQPYGRGHGRRHREGRQDDDLGRRAEDDQEIARRG